jgi:hypothetical protein
MDGSIDRQTYIQIDGWMDGYNQIHDKIGSVCDGDGSRALGKQGAGERRVKGGRQGLGLSASRGVRWCGQAGGPREDGGGRR